MMRATASQPLTLSDAENARIRRLELELQQLRKAICIINHLSAHELQINNAMEAIRQVACELLQSEKVTLFLVFKRQQELRGSDPEHGSDVIRVKFGEGIAGTVAKTGKLMNVPDAYAHPLFHAAVDKATGFHTRNILCASICDMNGRVVAVLQALNKVDQGHFTAADEHNIQLFSTHLGNTISKAKLHDKALREKQRLTDLYQTFKALNGAGSLDEILELTSCTLQGLLHASLVFVFVLDSPRQELWARYSTGTGGPHMVRVKVGSGLVGRAAQDNQPVVLSASARPSKSGVSPFARNSLGLPSSRDCFRPATAEGAAVSAPPTPIPCQPPALMPQGPASGPASTTAMGSATFCSGSSPRMTSTSPPPATGHAAATATGSAALCSGSSPRMTSMSPPLATGDAATTATASAALCSGSSPRAVSMSPPTALQTAPIATTSVPRQTTFSLPAQQQQQQLQQQQLTGIDKELMHQTAPALGGEPVRSLLVQPLAVEEKVVGAILCINKNEDKDEHDLFFEDCYTESDTKVMALFALEVSQMLADRSLEVALASAMLNVSYSQPQTGTELNAALAPNTKLSPEEAELLLRTQMIDMYYGTKFSHESRHTTCGGTMGSQPVSCNSSKPLTISPHHFRSYTLGSHPTYLPHLEGVEPGSRSCSQSVASADCVPIRRARSRRQGSNYRMNQSQKPLSASQCSRIRSHAVGEVSWSEAGYSASDSDSESPIDTECGSHPLGLQHNNSLPSPGVPLPPELESERVADGIIQPSGPGTSHTQRTADAKSVKSVLDGVAPWVDLCSSSSEGEEGEGGGGVLEPGSSSRGSSRGSSEAGESGVAAEPGAGQLQKQLGAAEERNAQTEGVPVPSLFSRLSLASVTSEPPPDVHRQASPLPSPSPSSMTRQHTSVSVGSPRHSPPGLLLPPASTSSQPQLLRAALSGSRRASQQPTCLSSSPHAASASLARQLSGHQQHLQQQEAATEAAQAQPFSPQHLWQGRLLKLASTHYPPEQLTSWSFDFTAFSREQLLNLSEDLFVASGVVEDFGLDLPKLRSFLSAVSRNYSDSPPYHNFNHVVYVLHATWLMLGTTPIQCILTPEDNLALLIAAICHDLQHDGYSNSYHVNIQSERALTYNDISVQENYHCTVCFSILRKSESALLEHLEAATQRKLRKLIVAAILSTDMAKHFEHCQQFNTHPPLYDKECEADRLLLLKVLLHAADIGNAVRPFAINQVMAQRVHKEFEEQAKKEAASGLPITFATDSTDQRMQAQVEVNFLDYVVTPLWVRLAEVMPQFMSQLQQLRSNRQRYEEMARSESERDEV